MLPKRLWYTRITLFKTKIYKKMCARDSVYMNFFYIFNQFRSRTLIYIFPWGDVRVKSNFIQLICICVGVRTVPVGREVARVVFTTNAKRTYWKYALTRSSRRINCTQFWFSFKLIFKYVRVVDSNFCVANSNAFSERILQKTSNAYTASILWKCVEYLFVYLLNF